MNAQKVDFEAKTDRELLVLVAQRSNDTAEQLTRLNSTISKHETRISKLEGQQSNPKWKINWQVIVWLGSVVALIIVAVGEKVSWW